MLMLLKRLTASVLAAKPGKVRFFAREPDGRLTAIDEAGDARALAYLDEVGGDYDPANVAITGGSINGTAIGNTVPASGTFSQVESVGDALINGLTVGNGAGNVGSNVVLGANAFLSNTTGGQNIALGDLALLSNGTGSQNVAIGATAMAGNSTGNSNVAIGSSALQSNTTGNGNNAFGSSALANSTTGDSNIGFGGSALQNCTTGSNNIAIGGAAGTDAVANITTESNQLVLGNNNITDAFIKVAFTVTSDARDKKDIAPLHLGLNFVNALEPVSFKMQDRETGLATTGTRYGFRAQDIKALEGSQPVIVNARDAANLKMNEAMLIPVLVRAVQELTVQLEALKRSAAS